MYGMQLFPTQIHATHLRYMMQLRNLFQLPIGYQDHCDGDTEAAFWVPAAAVGMGADIIEKHITHDRSFRGIDHEAALNPDEFARFVKMVREIELAMGDARPRPFSPDEQTYRKYRRRAWWRRAISRRARNWLRSTWCRGGPGLGLPPDQIGRLVGRTTRHVIAANALVLEEDVT